MFVDTSTGATALRQEGHEQSLNNAKRGQA